MYYGRKYSQHFGETSAIMPMVGLFEVKFEKTERLQENFVVGVSNVAQGEVALHFPRDRSYDWNWLGTFLIVSYHLLAVTSESLSLENVYFPMKYDQLLSV